MITFYAKTKSGKYDILSLDTERIQNHTIFAVVYPHNATCNIYYNEDNYPDEELINSGYEKVEEIIQEDTIVQRSKIY